MSYEIVARGEFVFTDDVVATIKVDYKFAEMALAQADAAARKGTELIRLARIMKS